MARRSEEQPRVPPDLLQIGGKPVLRELRGKQRNHQVSIATVGLADFDHSHVTYAWNGVPVTGQVNQLWSPPSLGMSTFTPRSRIASPGP